MSRARGDRDMLPLEDEDRVRLLSKLAALIESAQHWPRVLHRQTDTDINCAMRKLLRQYEKELRAALRLSKSCERQDVELYTPPVEVTVDGAAVRNPLLDDEELETMKGKYTASVHVVRAAACQARGQILQALAHARSARNIAEGMEIERRNDFIFEFAERNLSEVAAYACMQLGLIAEVRFERESAESLLREAIAKARNSNVARDATSVAYEGLMMTRCLHAGDLQRAIAHMLAMPIQHHGVERRLRQAKKTIDVNKAKLQPLQRDSAGTVTPFSTGRSGLCDGVGNS